MGGVVYQQLQVCHLRTKLQDRSLLRRSTLADQLGSAPSEQPVQHVQISGYAVGSCRGELGERKGESPGGYSRVHPGAAGVGVQPQPTQPGGQGVHHPLV